MPVLNVIAGPNGSGKSTLIKYLQKHRFDLGTYINPDDIAKERGLHGENGSRDAQALADAAREACLGKREDFTFETVMSHDSKIAFMARAREEGYKVYLYFVCTDSYEINIQRVKHRVLFGGHDVPVERIVARYHRTLSLLHLAIANADRTILFDNTAHYENASQSLRPFAMIDNDGLNHSLRISGITPIWAFETVMQYR